MLAVRKIEHPEKRVAIFADDTAASSAIEVSASQLWFAVRIQIAILLIIFKNIDDLQRIRGANRPAAPR